MDKAHGYADKVIEDIEKDLSEVYGRAQKELAKKAEAYMNKFIAEDEKQRKLVDAGELSEQEYKKWLKKKVMSGQRFTKMKEQCAEQLSHVNQIAIDQINDRLPDVYAVCYNAIDKDIKGLKGYSFHIVSPDAVKTLAGKDASLLPYKKIDPAVDIPWNMKAINAEVLQGVLQGESVKAITKRVFGYTTKTGKDQADILHKMEVAAARTARTLVTAAENKGRMDSYERAAKDGVVLQKEWIATNDSATRESHRAVDGQVVKEDEPFSNGLMFPGDWSGPPEEVYNCRCTMAAVVKGYISKTTGEYMEVEVYKGKKVEREDSESGNNEDVVRRLTEDSETLKAWRQFSLEDVELKAKAAKVRFREVAELDRRLSEKEIIDKLSGADRTKGSCASLAMSYCANKAGLDVTDYRGGASQDVFSSKKTGRSVIKTAGGEITTISGDTVKMSGGISYVQDYLQKLPVGEEYYLSYARHAAIVRMDAEKGFQFLEMQSARENGWKTASEFFQSRGYMNYEEKTVADLLRARFGATEKWELLATGDVSLAPVSSIKATDEFRQALGYINTETNKQRKGEGGYAK